MRARTHACLLLMCTGWGAAAQAQRPPAPRRVDLQAPDGIVLKATYFAAGAPGPGVLLFHQSNRTRGSWDDVSARLAAAGIHALAVDSRGHGDSGGHDNATDPDRAGAERRRLGDLDAAYGFLVAQRGVRREVIGIAGAGALGVSDAVETARRHPAEVKSLALLSGETLRPGIEFLRRATRLPALFVVSDADEYPPTVEAMELLYVSASSPAKKLVHYPAPHEAPWLWYEPFDVGKVPAGGHHGTDMFATHPELLEIVVGWLATTLVATPGHAPADPLAAAAILNRLQIPGGAAEVTRQLLDARAEDPRAQLFPEISAGIVGFDFLRAGDTKSAIEVLELVALAYAQSADAHDNLADACLAAGQRERARQEAEKALAILDSRAAASSWSDTPERRAEIRRDAEKVLRQLGVAR